MRATRWARADRLILVLVAGLLTVGLVGAQQQQTGTPQFEQPNYSGQEGETVTLTVLREGGSEGSLSAFYNTRDTGSASSETDYEPIFEGSLFWEDGDASPRTIEVTLLEDAINENDETFAVDLFWGQSGQDVAIVTIVDPSPDPVQAQPDQAYTAPGEQIVIPVIDNDAGDSLFVRDIVSPPENGEAFVGEDPDVVFYQPSPGFAGVDTFTYSVSDNNQNVDTAQVTVLVGLDSLEDLDENQRNLAMVLEEVCMTVEEGPLAERCAELQQMGPSTIVTALNEMAPEKAAAQGTSLVEAASTQIGNIRARLTALRAGASGMSMAGLTLRMDGESLPIGAIASRREGRSGGTWSPRRASGTSAYGSWGSPDPSPMGSTVDLGGPQGPAPRDGALAPAVGQTEEPQTGGELLREQSRLGMFINGRIEFGDKETTSNEVGFDFDTAGLTFGIDYRFSDEFVWGGSIGVSNMDSDFAGSGGKLESETFTLATYGNYYPGRRSYIDWIVSYGTSDFEMDRKIVYGMLDTTAVSQTDGDQWGVSVSSGMDFRHKGLMIGPHIRGDYMNATIDEFVEEGGSGLALAVDEQEIESFTGAIGGQASITLSRSWGILTPGVRLEWEHEFLDDDRLITSRFVGAPGSPFVIGTDAPDRDYLNFAVSLSALFRGGTTAFIDYERVLAQEDIERNIVNFGVRFEL